MRELLGEFTWHALLVKVLWTIILTVLTRFLMWVFRVTRMRERWYWVAVPLLVFCSLTVIHVVAGGANDIDIRPREEFLNIGAVRELDDRPALVVGMSVRNVGMPTILEGWTANVVLPNGKSIVMLPYQFPGTVTLEFANGKRTFNRVDSLYFKGLNPLVRGAMIRGILKLCPSRGNNATRLVSGKAWDYLHIRRDRRQALGGD
jgi:hypothetical protein